MFMNMDRCDSHTQNNHLATAILQREGLISGFQACSHESHLQKKMHCSFCSQRSYCATWCMTKGREKKVLFPVAGPLPLKNVCHEI